MKRRGSSDRDGDLTREDAALWDQVSRSVTRLDRGRVRVNRPITDEAATDGGSKRTPAPPASRSLERAAAPTPLPATPRLPAAPPIRIEPRKVRRVARGRDEIEARIDLHGMRQAEAHAALRGFVARAFHNGLRLVLVITGKGRVRDEAADQPFDLFVERDHGVLRRSVPRWLADPDVRAMVVGFTTAHARHGGEGALYVQLRNREKHRG
jgi:DNA-nicking Smr family endonuclease